MRSSPTTSASHQPQWRAFVRYTPWWYRLCQSNDQLADLPPSLPVCHSCRGFARGDLDQDLELLLPRTCIVDEAVESVRSSQNLVAQVVHAAQRAHVCHDTLHPLFALSTPFHKIDGFLDHGLSTAVHDDGSAVPGESRRRVPAWVGKASSGGCGEVLRFP